MTDYGHDEAMRVVKEIRACTLYGDRDWAQRVDRIAAYFTRLESDNAALLGVARAAYEALDEALTDASYGWCRIEHGVLGIELASLPDHIKEALK